MRERLHRVRVPRMAQVSAWLPAESTPIHAPEIPTAEYEIEAPTFDEAIHRAAMADRAFVDAGDSPQPDTSIYPAIERAKEIEALSECMEAIRQSLKDRE